jgi:hypothetical protein
MEKVCSHIHVPAQSIPFHTCIGVMLIAAACALAQWTDETGPSVSPNSARPLNAEGNYIIQTGDCLWDIAFAFYGDPFRWPVIWRANPYIQNPDLIFPDNILVIPGFGSGTSLATDTSGLQRRAADGFTSQTRGFLEASVAAAAKVSDSLETAYSGVVRALEEKKSFASWFLAGVPFLWDAKDAKGLIAPGNAVISKEKDRVAFREFESITLTIFGPPAYKPGDTVSLFHSERYVQLHEKTLNLVWRNALARIESVIGNEARGQVFRMRDIVQSGDRVAPMEQGAGYRLDSLAAPDIVIEGEVFQRVETSETPLLFQHVIIDKGAAEGVRIGDLFLSFPTVNSAPVNRPALLGCAVNCGDRASTLLIVKLFENRIMPGDRVTLVKRLALTQY